MMGAAAAWLGGHLVHAMIRKACWRTADASGSGGAEMTDRVYRDPVHGSVAFDWSEDRAIIELIDSREFQRLRRIRQLGAAALVFPGAELSRFTHSMGVAFLAKRLFDHLMRQALFPRDATPLRPIVLAAALLHDIGHGPYSHLFERVFAKHHEAWGTDILNDPETEVHRILKSHGLLEGILDLYARKLQPPFTFELISSQLDADRLDYLLRDSFMTGATYGRYDLDWLIEVIELAAIPPENTIGLAVGYPKGWHVAEQFVIGRHLMYQQVYFHRTIRAAEHLLKAVFERLRDLAGEGAVPAFRPRAIQTLLQKPIEAVPVSAYLALDDNMMNACISAWQDDRDSILRDLCRRVVHRDLFKSIELDAERVEDPSYKEALAAMKEECRKNSGFDPRYYLASDAAEDMPYKEVTDEIWVSQNGKARCRLSEISPLIQSISNTRLVTRRLCYPKELHDLVWKHLGRFIAP
jgi:HD superfamily phosphohydrolase